LILLLILLILLFLALFIASFACAFPVAPLMGRGALFGGGSELRRKSARDSSWRLKIASGRWLRRINVQSRRWPTMGWVYARWGRVATIQGAINESRTRRHRSYSPSRRLRRTRALHARRAVNSSIYFQLRRLASSNIATQFVELIRVHCIPERRHTSGNAMLFEVLGPIPNKVDQITVCSSPTSGAPCFPRCPRTGSRHRWHGRNVLCHHVRLRQRLCPFPFTTSNTRCTNRLRSLAGTTVDRSK
jgi:hypothetical protein